MKVSYLWFHSNSSGVNADLRYHGTVWPILYIPDISELPPSVEHCEQLASGCISTFAPTLANPTSATDLQNGCAWVHSWTPYSVSMSFFHNLFPCPEPVVNQWQSSGNPVCLELRPQCTLKCHWRIVGSQFISSVLPVVFQLFELTQELGYHLVLASANVAPVASQYTCCSSGLPVCSNYAN